MNLGVVGTGYWGSNHARVGAELRDAGVVDDVVLCDLDEERVADLAGTYDLEYVTDHADLSGRVDAAVVATPSPTHRGIAVDLLRAGVDLLVEKPLALTGADARAIVAAADEEGRTLATGHIFRYHPGLNELRDRLRRGELGRAEYLSTSRYSFRQPRETAGTLFSLAVHDVDIYTYLLGEWPDSVFCAVNEAETAAVDETATLTLTYGSTTATIDVSWRVPAFGKRRDLVVAGSEATGYVDYLEDTVVELYENTVAADAEIPTREESVRRYEAPAAEPLRLEVESFLEACRTGATPRASGRVGVAAVEILEAAQRSADTGRAIEIEMDGPDPPT
ncbi:Probable oxidoreductase [Halorubrum sp. DM2]|uniref:Gfo/Idh/MocA family protein n=1 Tax=unclassified Halorubrum TaxID=2642239 RepID=UPI0003DDA92D|nr:MULTISPECIES: Gfo/Idh/MocA family oxidoreductase [unclassified Halorubrum]CDK39712.1 oxidoreductase family, NAD-binding Rossmann fold family protein [Halorubrum sp. AJ67]VTT88042.1 Probable oxidoreductase [Halorubrum sp. DM2]